MNTLTIVLLVILVVLVGVLIALYFFGKKAQKKQEEQQAQIEAAKQTVSMLVIDKKRLRIKESGLPQMVIDQTPKMMRRTKLPIVKAKIGPKISILIADEKIYEQIPVKKEVKADISGLYIVGVRGSAVIWMRRRPRKRASLKECSAKKTKKHETAVRIFLQLSRILFTVQNPLNRQAAPAQKDSSPPHALHSCQGHNQPSC